MDLMGTSDLPPQGEDTPLLEICEQLTTKANAGPTRRLSSLFTAVFGIHSQPVLNRATRCSLRVTGVVHAWVGQIVSNVFRV